MKKQLLFFVLMLMPLAASADVVEINDIYYNLNAKEKVAEVTNSPHNYSGNVVIPSSFTYCGEIYSVTSIGDNAFYKSKSLISIIIPNSVTSIGKRAFGICTSLTSLKVESGNPVYDSRNNCNAIIRTADNTLIAGCENTIIPNNVTSIGNYAFYGTHLTSISIPNSVTSIGDYAFDSSRLTSITIPNSVTSIGEMAFNDCSLNSVTIGNSVTTIGERAFSICIKLSSLIVESGNPVYDSRDNCNAIIRTADNTLIAGCKNTIIPNDITSIGDNAFYYCSNLSSITIPHSVTTIGKRAFHNCSNLNSITIPNSVMSIGDGAFSNCGGLTSFTIPNSVTSIGDEAFQNCVELSSIIIGNNVTKIGKRLFASCLHLRSILVVSGNPVYDSRNNCNAIIRTADNTLIAGCNNTIIPNNVTNIGNYAFDCCSNLNSVTIPNSVESIGDYAFNNCYHLASITIPNSVTSIGEWAFYACQNLTSITIPSNLKSIRDYTFAHCSSLVSITIPNCVAVVGEKVFLYCSRLSSVIIGKGMNHIGSEAFNSCSQLRDVYCFAELVPKIDSNGVFTNHEDATLHVPAASLEAYSNAVEWNYFGNIVALTDDDPKPTGIKTIDYTNNMEMVFDLNGRRVDQYAKGLYIKNGKKYVVK